MIAVFLEGIWPSISKSLLVKLGIQLLVMVVNSHRGVGTQQVVVVFPAASHRLNDVFIRY